jgi:adenosylhomocysteine nucleosidase
MTRNILYVMATEVELGPHLRARINPVITGVGPVEAAAATALVLDRFRNRGQTPDFIVCLGSAGSRHLTQGEVYQASAVAYRDMDASPLGFARGTTPFLDLPASVPLKPIIPGLPQATLSTGAAIVSGAAYDAIDADMVDMETFAVLRAAMRFDVPLIGLRGISDGKAELRRYADWSEYLHVVDERLASAVAHLERAL